MTRVLGLDLSLTATGYAYNDEVVGVIRSRLRGPARLAAIRSEVLEHAHYAEVVVLEGYAFARPNQAHQLGELGGVIRVALHDTHIPYVEVPPAVLKRFATGRGNATKDQVLAAAIRRFGFEGEDNNAADAWLLRCMGLAEYDAWNEIEQLPRVQREALRRVTWPLLEVTA